MKRRLKFLVPALASCRAICAELEAWGLPDTSTHVVASQRYDLSEFHRATLLQRSDLAWGLEWGLLVGALAGLSGSGLVYAFPPAGIQIGWIAVAASTAIGAGAGAIVSALVAKDVPNHEFEAFQARIDTGELLMLIDVPTSRVQEVVAMILNHHPEAEILETRLST